MGVNLVICKKDGEYVADIGRVHNYTDYNGDLDINYDKLNGYKDSLVESILNRVSNILFYEKGKEYGSDVSFDEASDEINDVMESLTEDLYEAAEEFESIGSKKLLSYILEEDDLTYIKDY